MRSFNLKDVTAWKMIFRYFQLSYWFGAENLTD